MWTYSAYGLTLQSELALPELRPIPPAEPDVTLRLGPLEWWDDGVTPLLADFSAPGQALLCWERVGAYLARGGAEVVVDPWPGAPEDLVRLPLLGVVLAVLLHQRGRFVLHASAVEIGGEAVAFVGPKGQGKSSLAAALYARGHALVADDILVVDLEHPDGPRAVPGSAQLKLWPDAVRWALGEDPDAVPELAAGYRKRGWPVEARFAGEVLPLRKIFALAEGPALAARPLGPRASFAQLAAHTYVARFGDELIRGDDAVVHLRRCARLLRAVPVCALERPLAIERLADAARLVEAAMLELSPSRG